MSTVKLSSTMGNIRGNYLNSNALMLLATLLVCMFSTLVSNAKPYAGQELRVLTFRDGHSKAVEKNLSYFEKATGAKVILDRIASQTVATKTITDQLSGGSYDLYTVDEPFMPQLTSFFLPFEQWPQGKAFQKPNLTEFIEASVAGGSYAGQTFGLPINGNVYMYVYRSDLFNDPKEKENFAKKYKYELAPPKTLKQLRDTAEFFTRPPRLYGFAPFTKKSEGTTVEAIWLFKSFGIDLFDKKTGQLLPLKAKEIANAFTYYLELMQFSPRGSKSWHHPERMSAYSRGRIAQIMTWPAFVKNLEDKSQSLVVGKNAYAVPPHSKFGRPSPVAGTWTIALSKKSQNKELAVEFAYWWASQKNGKKLVADGMNPVRKDLFTDPDLIQTNPWFPGILENFSHAVVRPRSPRYKEVSDKISTHFTNMIVGQETPEVAAKELISDLQALDQKLKVTKK